MLEAREAVRTVEAIPAAAWAIAQGCVWISTRTPADVRRECWSGCGSCSRSRLACYPEREPGRTRSCVAFWDCSRSRLLLTNGVDEAIHLVCEAYLEPDDEALIVVPTFAMYEICAAATGARVISIPADEDFRFPDLQGNGSHDQSEDTA